MRDIEHTQWHRKCSAAGAANYIVALMLILREQNEIETRAQKSLRAREIETRSLRVDREREREREKAIYTIYIYRHKRAENIYTHVHQERARDGKSFFSPSLGGTYMLGECVCMQVRKQWLGRNHGNLDKEIIYSGSNGIMRRKRDGRSVSRTAPPKNPRRYILYRYVYIEHEKLRVLRQIEHNGGQTAKEVYIPELAAAS